LGLPCTRRYGRTSFDYERHVGVRGGQPVIERQDRHGRHDRRGAEGTDGEAQIPTEIVDQPDSQRVAILLLDLIEAAESQARPTDGFGTIESGLLMGLHLPIEMKPQLLIHLAFDPLSREQRS
jgi:hypothetical protein